MQNSMPSTAPSETSGSTKSARNAQPVKLTWTLQRLNRTWFISPLDGQAVRINHPLEDGATDEQWRALIRQSIRIRNDDKPWGPLDRRDFLNWFENTHPDRMPRFFESKEEALASKTNGSNEENSNPPDGAA